MFKLPRLLPALLLAFCLPAHANWHLDGESSRLSFITGKNGNTAEVHRFLVLHGTVDRKGVAALSIEMDSVSSGIPLRDERMREDLFEVERFAEAKVQAQLAEPGISASRRETLQEKLKDAQDERKGLSLASGLTDALAGDNVDKAVDKTVDKGLNKGIAKTVGKAMSAAAKDPEFAYYKLKANAYKFSWLLIVISLPFLWLLFPFSRRFKMYDHAIYVTYSIAFMSLLFSLSMILTAVGITHGLVTVVLLLFAAWHMYRQFKDAYQLSRSGTLLRLPLLYGFACASLSLFFAFLMMMG